MAIINLELSWEDYNAWKAIPATQEFFKKVYLLKRDEEQSMGRGASLDCNCSDRTQALSAKSVGIVGGIDLVLKLSPAGEDTESGEE